MESTDDLADGVVPRRSSSAAPSASQPPWVPLWPEPRPSESDCQRTIIDAAKATGWRVYHARAAQTAKGWRTPVQGHEGFPDLVLVHPGPRRVMFVELKRHPRRLQFAQIEWRDTLTEAGATYRLVWVPEQMHAFCQELADLAHAPRGVAS